MRLAVLLAAALTLASPAASAQEGTQEGAAVEGEDGFTLTPELDLDLEINELGEVVEVEEEQAAAAEGAVLRGLDKVTGGLEDLEMAGGETRAFGRLQVTLGECRYPKGNPAGDAWAYLVIRADTVERPVFEGWMIASSPALNALDHPRFDIWLLRCSTS